ncbi:DUF6197 family protein [Streptomyces fradiae]|uniref:DUF6197 family protein n=1 Tax=Streptomyces fradiae TaxID=1906 RepID=UPI0036FB6AB7
MTTTTRTRRAPAALDLDARLALTDAAMTARLDQAAVAFEVNTAHLPVTSVDLTAPAPAAGPTYDTPIADLLQRAHDRIQRDGWTTRQQRNTRGALCTVGAIRAADRSGHADQACAYLLEVIQQQLPDTPAVPAWNDQQTNAGPILRTLAHAARTASTNHL